MTLTSGLTIRYRNLNGAQVGVFEAQPKLGHAVLSYRAGCAGCLDTFGSAEDPQGFSSARTWAIKHSAECRAFPAPDPDDDDKADYRAEAQQYAHRAAEIIRGQGTQFELSDRTGVAMAYVGVADIYARLAGL
jgi:hypothetical protein